MSSISENVAHEKSLSRRVDVFFKAHRLGVLLKQSNAYKSKGIPVVHVFIYLVQLVFTKKSMYMNILNGTHSPGFGKDVVYRLFNATHINWSTFLLRLAMSVIPSLRALTDAKRITAIIFDDTMYERMRSKKVELLAKVYDHAAKGGGSRYKRGFRLLTMAWSDGASLIPLMFRHLSSKDKKHRYCEANPRIDKRSVGYKARCQALSTATDAMLWMLSQAKKACVPARHVLFDCWFSFPSTILRIREIGFYVVCRLKNTTKIMYLEGEKRKTLQQIYAEHKKRRGRSRYLLSVEVQLYNDQGNAAPARIVYLRDRNNRKKWIAFLTTDMALSEEEVIQLYGKRWDIEVFFRVCKSYLNLAKEFQGLSYDALTAHTAVVMTRYILLAVDKRQNSDPRSLGELFFSCYDEAADISFHEVISIILKCLCDTLNESILISDIEMRALIQAFVQRLSGCFSRTLALTATAG